MVRRNVLGDESSVSMSHAEVSSQRKLAPISKSTLGRTHRLQVYLRQAYFERQSFPNFYPPLLWCVALIHHTQTQIDVRLHGAN